MNISYKGIAQIAVLISLTLTTVSAQLPSQTQAGNSANTPKPISLILTVLDKKGGFVPALSNENFKILVDGSPAKIVYVRHEDPPISIGILIDASGSIGSQTLKPLTEGLARFLHLSHPSNEYFVLGFNSSPQLLLDWTSNADTIIGKLGVLQPYGNTAFFDTCYLAIDKVQHGRYSKQALIVISDGQDNQSHYSPGELQHLLRESDVVVYSIDVMNPGDAGSSLGMEGQANLDELSTISGGVSFHFKSTRHFTASEATSIFEIIASELRNQYRATLTIDNFSNGKTWHKVRVKVTPPKNVGENLKQLTVRTRDGIYLHR